MEEKAVLRVRDRISAALTVPYVRRAVWLMAGGLAGFLTARGLVFGKYAPFAAAGAAAAVKNKTPQELFEMFYNSVKQEPITETRREIAAGIFQDLQGGDVE